MGHLSPRTRRQLTLGRELNSAKRCRESGKGVSLTQPEGPRGRGFSRVVGAEAP